MYQTQTNMNHTMILITKLKTHFPFPWQIIRWNNL